MNQSQWIFSFLGVIFIVVLFQLPRTVVENEQLQEVATQEIHSLEIPLEIREKMIQLDSVIQKEKSPEKKTTFASALARYYLDYGLLDSAVFMANQLERLSEEPSFDAMDIFFKAYERSDDPEQIRVYAAKARNLLTQLLEKDPTNLSLKNKLAMTLVITENPMSGINLLGEVLEEDENNRQALLNLGLLAIQSGQFEKAKERFTKLLSLDTADYEAKLYMAVSMIEVNQPKQARLILQEILNVDDSIPAIKSVAIEYLKQL